MRWKISCGPLTGSGLQSEARRSVKMAVFAPIPSARVSTATAVKTGLLRSMRTAKRESCHHISTRDSQPAERTTSFDFEASSLQTHCAKGIFAAHALLHLFPGRYLEKAAQLFVQVLFDPFLSEQRSDTASYVSQQ